MHTLWIIVCNASIARVYQVTKDKFDLQDEYYHPESRLKGSELKSDGPGHFHTRETTRGAFDERTPPKEVEAEHFAQQIVHIIHNGWANKQFQDLIIAAPPHFLGLLRKTLASHQAHLHPHLKDTIDKDYTQSLTEEIKEIFAPYYKKLLTNNGL